MIPPLPPLPPNVKKSFLDAHGRYYKAYIFLKHSTTIESLAQLKPLQSKTLALLRSTRMGVAQLAYEPQLRTITANQPDRST